MTATHGQGCTVPRQLPKTMQPSHVGEGSVPQPVPTVPGAHIHGPVMPAPPSGMVYAPSHDTDLTPRQKSELGSSGMQQKPVADPSGKGPVAASLVGSGPASTTAVGPASTFSVPPSSTTVGDDPESFASPGGPPQATVRVKERTTATTLGSFMPLNLAPREFPVEREFPPLPLLAPTLSHTRAP